MLKTFNIFIFTFLIVFYSLGQKLSLGYIYPAGGERGEIVNIEIGGLNITNATGVIISGDGIKAEIVKSNNKIGTKQKSKNIFSDQSSPQLADRITVQVTIDKNATPGFRDLRLESLSGISNKLNFEVGQYPDFLEKKVKVNQVEKLPVTLCGQIMPGDVDSYSFTASKGMNLVAEVKARALVPYIADAVPGWFQPVIRITGSRGNEIAYNDDFRNSVDPVIETILPENDTYILTIHDAIYRGREDFNYRIDLGEIPHLNFVYPAAGNTGKNFNVFVKGMNLQYESINFKPALTGYNELKVNGKNGALSNPVSLYGLSKNVKLQSKPTDKNEIKPNSAIFDSLTTSYQIKKYYFRATGDENLIFEINSLIFFVFPVRSK